MQPLSIAENRNATAVDPLPSWNQGNVKARILNFVKNVTNSENTNYITPEDRIAVFDNDGTLWAEKPTYFQGFFVLDRLEELSKSNPEISRNPQLQQLLNKDFTNLQQLSKKDIMSLVMLTHSNITQHEFNKMVQKWAETAHHPQTQKRFVQMVYQPMNELIDFLKLNHFKTFIVSGGGIDFIREALSNVYGIPPDQIIGSSIKFRYINGTNRGNSTILREPELASFNEKEVKPENIQLHIGKVPVFAAGNADGDLEMLRYTADNNSLGKSLEILVHHDDGVREYSYDTQSENVLIEAQGRNWTIVSMKDDFRIIYPNTNSTN
ncbi:MAG TPA: HAD family hydrolase [Nitrososphaeraceae archaeon]|nr:HAD family hydrolase [Nitrososphaeraceae archaeon]